MRTKKEGLPHEASALSEDLSKRLAAYALAATATTGLGLGAAAAPALASIISHPFSHTIPQTICSQTPFGPGWFRGGISFRFSGASAGLGVEESCERAGQANNPSSFQRIWAGGNSVGIDDTHLGKGSPIGPDTPFKETFLVSANNFNKTQVVGPWAGLGKGYLGFEFNSHGADHFGWLALSIYGKFPTHLSVHVGEYAYDTVAGQTIDAGQTSSAVPEPGTLALLAFGAAGLAVLREKKRSALSDHESAE
jgi:hypothetical protein